VNRSWSIAWDSHVCSFVFISFIRFGGVLARVVGFLFGFGFWHGESLVRQGLDAAGLPRRFAPRNDSGVGIFNLSTCCGVGLYLCHGRKSAAGSRMLGFVKLDVLLFFSCFAFRIFMTRKQLVEIDRSKLIKRLFKVLEGQITQLEKNNMANSGEKEVALLGLITRNLDKLIDLDQKEGGNKPSKKRRNEFDELRKKLSERIEHLKSD